MGDTESNRSNEIPEDLRGLFELLRSDVIELQARWKMFKELYATNQTRLELLRESASWFFETLRVILLDDVILGIARLTDPARTLGQENQSLEKLMISIDHTDHPDLVLVLERLLKLAQDESQPFREHRNKRLAHRDLEKRLEPGEDPLPDLSFAAFDRALKAVSDFLNEIEVHFADTAMGYEHVITPYLEDVDGLVWTLKKAAAIDTSVDQMRVWELIELTKFKEA